MDAYHDMNRKPEDWTEAEIEQQRSRFCSVWQVIEEAELVDEYEAYAPAPAAPAAPASAGAVEVKAPMPGNILDVKVAAGASVKAGDVLVILEAMKMENEIVAPQDGTVASVNVNKGDTVNSGDVLVSMN